MATCRTYMARSETQSAIEMYFEEVERCAVDGNKEKSPVRPHQKLEYGFTTLWFNNAVL